MPAVLTARGPARRPGDAATVDVLDAARRLVALDPRHLDRVTTAGHLTLHRGCARWPARSPGRRRRGERRRDRVSASGPPAACATPWRWPGRASRTPQPTSGSARCTCPSPSVLGLRAGDVPQEVLARAVPRGDRHPLPRASPSAAARGGARLEDELGVIAELGYATYFLTVAEVVDLIRDMGVRVAARGSGPGSLVNYLLGISGVDPLRHGLLMERFLSPLRAGAARHRHRRGVRAAHRDLRADPRALRRRPRRLRLDDGHLPGAARDPRRRCGARPAARWRSTRWPRRSRTSAPATPATRSRELPELRASRVWTPRGSTLLFDLVERLDGLPRHVALHPCGVMLSDRDAARPHPGRGELRSGFPMSQFDKDDVEDLGPAQARRPRHPDAVGDGARRRRDRAGRRRSTIDLDDRVARCPRRRADLRADPLDPHPRLLPDRVPGPARAGRQVRARDLRRPHHRHLAVPARSGEVRHGHPVPPGPAGLARAASTSTPTSSRCSGRPTGSWSSTSR